MKPDFRSIRRFAASAALALLAGNTTAGAAGEKFAKADADHNNAISLAEFDAFMKRDVFTRVDKNADGKVTLAEWQGVNPNVDAAKFLGVDTNRDGGISRKEADAAFDREGTFSKLFKQADANGDGSLSQVEVQAFRTVALQQPGNNPAQKLSLAA